MNTTENNIKKNFSRRLQGVIKEKGYSEKRESLAKIFDTSPAMAQYYWSGTKMPSMQRAISICCKIGVNVEWLLTGRGPKYPAPDDSLSPEAVSVALAWQSLPDELREQVSRMILSFDK